ncbi:MAG: helix-hairpin-helix domain-containing protein [bacterium]
MIELKKIDIVQETKLKTSIDEAKIRTVLNLVEEGCTIPFIARYRKEKTGNLDELQVAEIIDVSNKIAALDKRKNAILKSLVETGSYTDELGNLVDNAPDMTTLEDIYAPYRPGRKTRADKAIEAGLSPLSEFVVSNNPDKESILNKALEFISDSFKTAEEVLGGVKDIVAQKIADDLKVRGYVRERVKNGTLFSKVKRGKKEEGVVFSDYFDFSEPVSKIVPHRVMALNRGEKEGFLNITVSPVEEFENISSRICSTFFNGRKSEFFNECIAESYDRLLSRSIETEVFNELKEVAIESSLTFFHSNLEQILLAPPFGEKPVIGIDPGIRTGCKAVLLDDFGNYVDSKVLYLSTDKSQALKIEKWIKGNNIKGIAVGSGTFGRETSEILKSYFKNEVEIVLVDEDGASIYSAGSIAREEFPDLDLTVRGAVSIGRRFQDPLSELVKIAPESLGIGQYQHDIPQKMLSERLTRTVEWAVNKVGANLNTASPYLLSYISGLDSKKARNISDFRKENGRFSNILQLKEIKGIGAKTFEQCAGFLRVLNGTELLDSTGVHPESYETVKKAAMLCNVSVEELLNKPEIIKKNVAASEIVAPSIIEELQKKGLDPRKKFESVEFSDEIKSMSDLEIGMTVNGVVDNILAFGAFIDIGIKEKGLLHISEIANEFVKNPSDYLKIGQIVKVKILSVDVERKRISLSMKN